ncbi:hypothetical protein [Pseudomonas ogarae]|nr:MULTISPECIES: hypothetical protein [Pseudomonas]
MQRIDLVLQLVLASLAAERSGKPLKESAFGLLLEAFVAGGDQP